MSDLQGAVINSTSDGSPTNLPDGKTSGFINEIKEIVNAGLKSHPTQNTLKKHNIYFTQNLKRYSAISPTLYNDDENLSRNYDAFNECKAAAMERLLFAHEDIKQTKRLESIYCNKPRQSCIIPEFLKYQTLGGRSAALHAFRLNKTRQDNREALFTALALVDGLQFGV
ncbi:unnamed protein product [Trichobilharzia regenti]|uniref:Uncharacterized protein n=1 Tax=Trichobilharzia regenti TaxID=157069 RepID=A0A183W0B9_TRIRE|nr:unnamed protein product [Trichobilharzia regenti]VDQ02053.1 unnamed protein product [Trichobilharzia regenti]